MFYGALSDVEYWITVVDHALARSRTYRNAPGEICGRGDVQPFESLSRGSHGEEASGTLQHRLAASSVATPAAHPAETCVADTETLCLLDGRFRVRVDWRDQHGGGSGVGGAIPFAESTGFFWFFRPDNVELVVKVLDGTQINGKIWVFYGALSDVGYTIEVTDVVDGHVVREYVNPPGNLCGDADTAAF